MVAHFSELSAGDPDTTIETIDPPEAAARIREALELTDITFPPIETDSYPAIRPLLDARLRTMPAGGEAPRAPELPEGEREAAKDLARMVGANLSSISQKAGVVRAAAGFAPATASSAGPRSASWAPWPTSSTGGRPVAPGPGSALLRRPGRQERLGQTPPAQGREPLVVVDGPERPPQLDDRQEPVGEAPPGRSS